MNAEYTDVGSGIGPPPPPEPFEDRVDPEEQQRIRDMPKQAIRDLATLPVFLIVMCAFVVGYIAASAIYLVWPNAFPFRTSSFWSMMLWSTLNVASTIAFALLSQPFFDSILPTESNETRPWISALISIVYACVANVLLHLLYWILGLINSGFKVLVAPMIYIMATISVSAALGVVLCGLFGLYGINQVPWTERHRTF